MGDIIHGYSVQQKHVFVCGTAPDKEVGEAVHPLLNTGKELDGFQDILLSQDYRSALEYRYRKLHDTHLRGADARFRDCANPGFRQRLGLLQTHIDGRVPLEVKRYRRAFIPRIVIAEGYRPLGQRKGVSALIIGYRALVSTNNFGRYKRFPAGFVRDIATDGHLLCGGIDREE